VRLALVQSFLPSRSEGGVGHFTDQLANQLAARGHEVTVFSLDPAPAGADYEVVNPHLGLRWTASLPGRLYGFAAWVARQDLSDFDLVHAMGDDHFITGIPVVRTFSGSSLAEALHARRLRTRAMYLSLYPLELVAAVRATRRIGISENTLRHFPGSGAVIPQGVDLGLFHPGPKSPRPSILSVGHRLRDRKRLRLLIDAFVEIVRPQIPAAELWLVADEAVVAPGVRCESHLSNAELASRFREAWVFCLPSAYEAFGRPYAEAMASGTAVVATPNPGALEVLAGGSVGVLVEPVELGDALTNLLQDGPRRNALAAAGLERSRSYGWDEVAAAYEAVYLEVARSAPRVRSTRT